MNQQPTPVTDRIELLDVYRGFAIMGIFVVNIVIMNSTFLNQDVFLSHYTSVIDQAAQRILQLFFYTKFFPIFSLLFGLGIAMQALKLLEKDASSSRFFRRRMTLLFLIGVIHILFLWSGDVVHLYAILGLLTTWCLRLSDGWLIVLSIGLLIFPFYDWILELFFSVVHFDPGSYLSDLTGKDVNRIIRHGSYMDGAKLRVLEYLSNIPMLFGFLAPIALSMFLLGLYLGRNRIYERLDRYLERIKRPVLWIALFTNLYRLCFLFVLTKWSIYEIEVVRSTMVKLMVISDVAMGLFYLWLLGWIWYHSSWSTLLQPLKHVGRMALTNYILQSLIGLILFSSMGLSLYESMSPSICLLVAIVVFTFQVVLSKIWLNYFRYGPLEWIWRCLSYGKWFALLK